MTNLTLAQAVHLFGEARVGTVSPATEAWYTSRLARLVDELGPDTPLAAITLADLWHWRASLVRQKSRWADNPHVRTRSGGLSRSTIAGHIRAIKAFFAWCVDKHLLDTSPAADLERVKIPDMPPRWTTPEAVEKLLTAAAVDGPRSLALIRLMVFSGLRVGEVAHLRRVDVELRQQRAHIRNGKGSKYRVVYFDRGTAESLWHYMRQARKLPDLPLFWGERGPLTGSGIRQALTRLCDAAHLPRLSPHQLRHTFAHQSVKHGVDPDKLRRQLGHSALSTTYNSYVKWQYEDLADAFANPWLDENGVQNEAANPARDADSSRDS